MMGQLWKRWMLVMVAIAVLGACSDDVESGAGDGGFGDGDVADSGGDAADTHDAGGRGGADAVDDADQEDADRSDAVADADGGGEDGFALEDCDYDGIYDHEERELGTDPCEADTDRDGLTDQQELNRGTDPLEPDTDGDGVSDGEEADLDLDPTREQTYSDRVDDGERWIVSACDEPAAEPVVYHESQIVDGDNLGNWQIALPPAFDNYTEVSVDGADLSNRHTAAVFDDPSNEVAAALTSAVAGEPSVEEALAARRAGIEAVGEIEQDADGSGFDTHDYQQGAIGRYRVVTEAPMSITELRKEILFATAPFASEDVTGLPAAGGAKYANFRVFVSVIYRTYENGQSHALTALAISPASAFDASEKVGFRMNDLIDTTHIAQPGDHHELRCRRRIAQPEQPVDFYWVLDHSGSMIDDNTRVAQAANQFFNRLDNSNLDYRIGVANMKTVRQGQLRPSAGWHRDMQTFTGEIDWIIDMDGYIEAGLGVAQMGIQFMRGLDDLSPPPEKKIREDAALINVWMTDDEEEYFQNVPLSTATAQNKLAEFVEFFADQTTGFAIIGDGDECGVADGYSYRQVVQATGGSVASLCSDDMSETINDIIYSASAQAGYQLSHTPISSTLRVFRNGQWVPRSREDGFDYFAETNSISFFGSHRPRPGVDNKPDDRVVVNYERYDVRRKNPTTAN